jgi:hypothetical protein
MTASHIRRKCLIDDECCRCCGGASVATGLHERNPQWNPNLTHKISQSYQTTRQYRNYRQRLVPVVILDLPTHFL